MSLTRTTADWVRLGFIASLCMDAFGACAPDTNLLGESSGGGEAPGGGTSVSEAALLDPAPGSAMVPVNLSAITIGFPRNVTLPEGAARISPPGSPQDRAVSLGQATVVDCPLGASKYCVRIPVAGALLPVAAYEVALEAGVVSDDGQALGAGPLGQFSTAAVADLAPPGIQGFSIEPSGPCLLARFETNESAAGQLVIDVNGAEHVIPAGSGVTQFLVASNVIALGATGTVRVFARAADLAGNVAESPAVEWVVPASMPPVAVTEIRANPVGPEPAQEFVEVKNLGDAPIDLGGFAIEDAKGKDVLPAFVLAPGAYALIVPSGFDASNSEDTVPAASTPLVRIDARIGSDGLSNSGETVRLRTSDGMLVSSYSAAIAVSAAAWAGKSIHRIPEVACDQAATWTQRPLPSTPGWGPP